MEMKYGQIAAGRVVNNAIYRCFEYIVEEDARAFVKKFGEQPHDEPQVMHTFQELVLGAFLCREGLPARYDIKIDGKTPDWSVLAPDVKGIVELVNFHNDKATEDEMNEKMVSCQSWCGWLGSNENRLYARIWDKAAGYREIRQRRGIPYVVSVFGSFKACVYQDELDACLTQKDHGLFGMYPDLSGVLYFEENSGLYPFRYISNPTTERPWDLPSGLLDLSR